MQSTATVSRRTLIAASAGLGLAGIAAAAPGHAAEAAAPATYAVHDPLGL